MKVGSSELKLGDVVTHIKSIDSRVEVCAPKNKDLNSLFESNSQGIFASGTLNFLKELSDTILKDKESRQFPDVIAFAIWCRNLDASEYSDSKSYRQGRGLVFHITPGNVPINFAYSLVTGLLSGNTNIVRLPSKKFEQVEFLVSKINLIIEMDLYSDIRKRFALIRYPKEKSINDYFSERCDARVIWGGNRSINEIRNSQIPAKSNEITFADRFSFCAINSDEYLRSNEKIKIAQGFYNDTYLFDQNACTAPHLITWIGDEKSSNEASIIFWNNIETLTSKRYTIEPIQIMDKLVSAARFSASNPDAKLVKTPDSKIFRFKLPSMQLNLEDFKSHSGLFYEVTLQKLDELVVFISNNYQTMTYFGFAPSELNEFTSSQNLKGIDRVVPIGGSLDFSFIWDGHDLINALSRKVTVTI